MSYEQSQCVRASCKNRIQFKSTGAWCLRCWSTTTPEERDEIVQEQQLARSALYQKGAKQRA